MTPASGVRGAWRVARPIDREFAVRYPPGHVWKLLVSLDWSTQRSVGRELERNEPAISHWKKVSWPHIIKEPKKDGRTVVILDESGLSQRPHRCRTSSRRGHTPVLQYHFDWKKLSVITGITLWNFYFRFYPGSIRAPQVVAFLKHLLRHISGNLLLVGDRLPADRRRVVQQFVGAQTGRIRVEYLTAYALELNPTEYNWDHAKHHRPPNVRRKDFAESQHGAGRALRNMRRIPTLFSALWKQASLWSE